MPLTLRQQWGEVVTTNLRNKLITRNMFNSNYQRDAASGAIMIPIVEDLTARNYNRGNITNNTIGYDSNKWIQCVIDKDVYLKELIDGYEAGALPYDVLKVKLERAGYSFAKAMDLHGLQTLIYGAQGLDKNGNAFTQTDPRYDANSSYGIVKVITAADDVYDIVTDLGGDLSDRGVPEDGRYLAVNGKFKARILQSNKAIRQGQLSQELVLKGVLAEIAGFEVYSSGNVTGTDASGNHIDAIAGHADFATRVEAFATLPEVVNAGGSAYAVGGVFVNGRYVFTHEVTNPKAFGLIVHA